jgi:hypothetical protein
MRCLDRRDRALASAKQAEIRAGLLANATEKGSAVRESIRGSNEE